MQYVAASLGVQCNYCHVMGDNASDDKETKQTARKMMQMVADLNKQFFAGKPAVSCASCHNGHAKPSRTAPLAINMTQDEAAAAAAARGRRGGGPGGAPGGAPRCALAAPRWRARAARAAHPVRAGGSRWRSRTWSGRSAASSSRHRDGRSGAVEVRAGARRTAGAAEREDTRDDRHGHQSRSDHRERDDD